MTKLSQLTVGFGNAFCAAPLGSPRRKELERTGGPYVPTPQVVVDQMLRMANVGAEDFVVDLRLGRRRYRADGGDASSRRAASASISIPSSSSTATPKRSGSASPIARLPRAGRVQGRSVAGDRDHALSAAPMMVNLRPKIFLEAKPGTRVVSHDYNFDDWRPDDQIVPRRAREGEDKRRAEGDDHSVDRSGESAAASGSCRSTAATVRPTSSRSSRLSGT